MMNISRILKTVFMTDFVIGLSVAIKKMNRKGVTGKETTPFLLNEIAVKTNNKSLNTNIHLALNNIRLGAKIAKKL